MLVPGTAGEVFFREDDDAHVDRRTLLGAPTALGFAVGAYTAFQRALPLAINHDPGAAGAIAGLSDLVGFALSPAAVFALAYVLGRRLDAPREWRRIAVAFGVYGGVAFAVGFVATAFAFLGADAVAIPGLVVAATYTAVFRGVSFALVGVAGTAVADYRGR